MKALLEQGAADMFEVMAEELKLEQWPRIAGGQVKPVRGVLGAQPMAYPLALGGAVVECCASALVYRTEAAGVVPGWRVVAGDGRVFEVLRVESSTPDPLLVLELARRK